MLEHWGSVLGLLGSISNFLGTILENYPENPPCHWCSFRGCTAAPSGHAVAEYCSRHHRMPRAVGVALALQTSLSKNTFLSVFFEIGLYVLSPLKKYRRCVPLACSSGGLKFSVTAFLYRSRLISRHKNQLIAAYFE